MTGYFDIRTLSLISGIIAITMGGVMLYIATSQKVYPGFSKWTVASLLNGIGMLSLGFRDFLPDFLTIVIANSFIILFFVLIANGFIEFVGGKQKIWLDITPVLVLITTFLYFTYLTPHVSARIIIISLIIALVSWRTARIIYKQVPTILPGYNWFLLGSFVFLMGWFGLRIPLTLAYESHISDFMASGIVQGFSFVVVFVSNITIVTGLIIINAQRLAYNLLQANAEIKTLSGLLPICSSCKKIRDEEDKWHPVDVYIRGNSDINFSHGICPDCTLELYPDLFDSVDDLAQQDFGAKQDTD